MKQQYKSNISLNHNEIPASVNLETGEIKIKHQPPTITLPDGITIYDNNSEYRKVFSNIDAYLQKKLTPIEYAVVCIMSLMAKYENNSLTPIDDNTSIQKLSEYFAIDRRKIQTTLNKLFQLGVYGKFEITEIDKEYKKYWILNPYIAHKGKRIEKDVISLFHNTEIAFYHRYCLEQQKSKQQLNK